MRYFLIFGLAATLFFACDEPSRTVRGSGNHESDARSVVGFDAVQVSDAIDVEIFYSDTYKVIVEGDDNIVRFVNIDKDGDELTIKLKSGIRLRNANQIVVKIWMPRLSSLSVGGSGSVRMHDQFTNSHSINLVIGGSGEIDAWLHCPKIAATIGGSGNIKARGEARDVEVSIGGSGSYQGFELKSENVEVNIGGSGDADVYCSKQLELNLAGSGSVNYKGDPDHIDQNKIGAGSLNKVD